LECGVWGVRLSCAVQVQFSGLFLQVSRLVLLCFKAEPNRILAEP
jgi:hypothetical protein